MTEMDVVSLAVGFAKASNLMLSRPQPHEQDSNIYFMELWRISEPFPEQVAITSFAYRKDCLNSEGYENRIRDEINWAIMSLKQIEKDGIETGQLQGA